MTTGHVQRALVAALLACAPLAGATSTCGGVLYLTFDTGNMQHAEAIAQTLRRHAVKATFFVANEPTARGDHALDPSWRGFWAQLADEGHAFGSHTWSHGRIGPDGARGTIAYRPMFGTERGRALHLTDAEFCAELKRPDDALRALTGRGADALWRAPGGRTTPGALAAARACGYAHVHWAPAGFLGDELPSDRYPNAQLLAQALSTVRDGDVLMAHLGIWSRREAFAPAIDPLIAGLKQRGFCFRTLREHPQYRASEPPVKLAAGGERR